MAAEGLSAPACELGDDMARYFFDLQDGEQIPDEVGTDFATLEDARHHAAITIASLLIKNPAKFWSGKEWEMLVRDDLGLTLFSLAFIATEAPVAAGHHAQLAL